jgi:hypothetical protein
MLDLEVLPERSIGNEQWEFLLGMPFYQAVYILQKHDTMIKAVQIWYNDQNPLLTDLVMDLTSDGIRLIFDSNTQQLKILEVYNLSKVKLKYCGSVFNSPSIQPTIQQIDQSFGATHPGVYHAESQLFVLNFRGLSFEFKLESKCEPRYTYGLGALQFRQGTSPIVSRMLIYTGNSLDNTWSPPMPLSCFHGSCFLDNVNLLFDNGNCDALQFTLISECNSQTKMTDTKKVTKTSTVRFGDTCQDVMSALGCPSKVYYKDEDKMKIHTSATHKMAQADRRSDYFFNYFTLGVDILFDSQTHRACKFVLHTNFPGHYDFNVFYRCKLRIPLSAQLISNRNLADVPGDGRPDDNIEILYNSTWHSVQDLMIPQGRKPVVLNRAPTTNTTNPFGCTYCHAVRNIIFEVMQNDHIATVTVYSPKARK